MRCGRSLRVHAHRDTNASVHVAAYVLMTNHVHLLMTPQYEYSIAKVMQTVGRKYVRYINGTYKRTGTLWPLTHIRVLHGIRTSCTSEGRYKASVIQSDMYLLRCYRYIELNPACAGMTDGPMDYKWSSYGFNGFNRKEDVVCPHEHYLKLGQIVEERTTAYRELFRHHIDDKLLSEIRDVTNQCRVLGNDHFRKKIALVLDIKTTPQKQGRPRKK